ncbi:hypothetical protein AAGG49_22180, partial [Stenotrophomonas maltophilia]|uniref:hypothetical protein n=1 Tax=Stenotrophomonas maltophilia TaxID=40324 RepID=UPI00313B4F47
VSDSLHFHVLARGGALMAGLLGSILAIGGGRLLAVWGRPYGCALFRGGDFDRTMGFVYHFNRMLGAFKG